jgi:hypothetical protein
MIRFWLFMRERNRMIKMQRFRRAKDWFPALCRDIEKHEGSKKTVMHMMLIGGYL